MNQEDTKDLVISHSETEVFSTELSVLKNLIETNPALEGVHLNPKSIREFNKNANLLQRSINQQYSTKHEIRREIGRLEAWQRIAAKKQRNSNRNTSNRNRTPRARTPEVNINEVRQKASSGDSISLNELNALLAKGGIASIGNNEPKASANKDELFPRAKLQIKYVNCKSAKKK